MTGHPLDGVTITLLDGNTVEESGQCSVANGVLYIVQRGGVTGRLIREIAYPLTSILKWERGDA